MRIKEVRPSQQSAVDDSSISIDQASGSNENNRVVDGPQASAPNQLAGAVAHRLYPVSNRPTDYSDDGFKIFL